MHLSNTLLACLAALGVYGAPEDNTPKGGFLKFPAFLAQVKDATHEQWSKTRVESRDAFGEMKKHILTMYSGVRDPGLVSSFFLAGDYVDCIPVMEQPTVHLLGIGSIDFQGPRPAGPNETSTQQTENAGHGSVKGAPDNLSGGMDSFGNKISCPTKTIPMARLSLESITRFKNLRAFFEKGRPPPGRIDGNLGRRDGVAPSGDGSVHLHATGWKFGKYFGGNSWLNLWLPKGDFSISQQWHISDSPVYSSVEGGWQRYDGKWGDEKPRLFIYHRRDWNQADTGCYNLDCPGFVYLSSNQYLGHAWTQYSTLGGTQWGMEMQWKLYRGNWYLFVRGVGDYELLGYYKGELFEKGNLAKFTDRSGFGGEVAEPADTKNWSEMGSGHFANEAWTRAAFQKTIFYIPHDENGGVGEWADLHETTTSSCYTWEPTPASKGGDWGSYFYFGGPGGPKCN